MKTLANSLVTVSSKIEVVLNVLFFSFSFALLRKEHAFAVLIEVKRGSLHFLHLYLRDYGFSEQGR